MADCRQLYHRAGERIVDPAARFAPARDEHRQLLDSFVAAARDGHLDRLRSLLAGQATAWTDSGGKVRAARNPVHGPEKVARLFVGLYRRHGAGMRGTAIDVNGSPGLLVDRPDSRHVLTVTVEQHRIGDLFVIANPDKLTRVGGPSRLS